MGPHPTPNTKCVPSEIYRIIQADSCVATESLTAILRAAALSHKPAASPANPDGLTLVIPIRKWVSTGPPFIFSDGSRHPVCSCVYLGEKRQSWQA